MRKVTACAALLVATMMLAGCGQKGPLYLPDQKKASFTEQTQPVLP
ncbi:LPS translocon maturation chaperone LptM [Endozoicomonadaceae bacterium StTr2]